VDLPNILWIAHSRNRRNKKKFDIGLAWKAINALVTWINQCSVPCYIHTTPSLCKKGRVFINHLYEKTNSIFIHYQWDSDLDEDSFFLSFSLERGTWIISRDSFQSHSLDIQKMLTGRVFIPNYCPETNEISFELLRNRYS